MNSAHPQCRFRRKPLYAAVLANFVALGTTACVSGGLENPCTAKNPCAAAAQVAAANPCAAKNPCAANPCAANPCAAAEQLAAANPCATKNPCNPCAANPCAANPCAAKNPCAANPCAAKNPCAANPCAAKNPCAANPCAAKNPCNPCAANPCAAKNPCAANPCAAANPCNPCAANPCNPCGANPCGAASLDPALINRPEGTALMTGAPNEMVEAGKALWNDTKLSSNGLACETCHSNNQAFLSTFAEPYPHQVAMPKAMAGMNDIDLDEMVQLCMVVPMAADPLGWESKELAALTAYTAEVQKSYIDMVAANPCAAQTAANPCNPCAAANPCNPCAAANPCNPCADCG